MPNLEDNFKYFDLIYGFRDERKSIIAHLKAKHIQTQRHFYYTVDELNKELCSAVEDMPTFIANLEKNFKGGEKEEQLLQHFRILQTPPHPKLTLASDAFPATPKKLDKEDRQIRRTCKARLLEGSIKIHFILSKIDLDHTFNREYSLKHSEVRCIYDSYTSAEIHFILKNYEKLKNHVFFYIPNENYEQVDLLDWLVSKASQAAAGKLSLLRWLKEKETNGKIAAETVQALGTRLEALPASAPIPEEKNEEELEDAFFYKKTDRGSVKRIFSPPPTPYKKGKSRPDHHNASSSHFFSRAPNRLSPPDLDEDEIQAPFSLPPPSPTQRNNQG